MKRAKRIIGLLLCLILVFGAASALAGGLTITEGADALEEASQFPFLAETDELAVNVREGASTRTAKIGRLERGTQLTVIGAEIGTDGELYYRVLLADGPVGYIRGDLLRASESDKAQSVENTAALENETRLIGNVKSKKYHEPGCRSLPAEKNRIYFRSADEAEDEGYVHCQNCD